MAKIIVTDKPTHLELIFKYNKELVEEVKLIPGRKFDGERKLWKVPLTQRRAVQRLIEKYDGKQIAHEQVPIADQESSTVYPTCTRSQPWPHQLAGFQRAWNSEALLLHLDLGSGKSKIIIDYCLNKPDIRRVLVVCPLSVVAVWPFQFETHGGKPVVMAALNSGTVEDKLKRAQLVFAEAARRSMIAVVVINYDSLWREPFAGWALDAKFDLLVLDECQRIRKAGSKVSKFAARLGRVIPVRFGCSGTPCSQSPLDIYGIYRTLQPSIFGTRYETFARSYATFGGFQGRAITGFINQEALRAKIDLIRFRAEPQGYKLPPEVHTDVILELPEKARKIYTKLAKEFVVGVANGSVVASNAAVLLTRLQALASGFLPVEDKEGTTTLQEMHTAKREALITLFDGADPSAAIVVFCRFRHDLAVIHEAAKLAGRTSSELSGKVKTVDDWKEGRTTVLATQLRAGSVGVDLTRSSMAIYMTYTFLLEDFSQSMGRIRRANQKASTCFYHHLLTKDTVDVKIRKALENKQDVINALLGGDIGE